MQIACANPPMKNLLIPGFLLLGLVFSAAGGKNKKVELIEGIVAHMPVDFYRMDDRDILERYMFYKMPLAMYSSEDRLAEFGVAISDNFWEGGDLELLGEFQLSNLNYLFDNIQIESKGIREVHKSQVYFFEFMSSTVNSNAYEKKYTIVQYLIIQNRILVFNFSCPQFEREKYQEMAWQILNSIKVKKNPF
jgi:hypothetical protein